MFEEQHQAAAIIRHEIQNPPFGMSFHDWFRYKKDLEAKKSRVRAKAQKVKKNFINVDENYTSTEASDVYEAVRVIMNEEMLGFSPEFLYEEETKTNSMHGMMKAFMQITWTDLETGYFEQQKWLGTGADNGDKGVYKAYTGAIKYALQATFLLSTENPEQQPRPIESKEDPFEKEMKQQEEKEAAAARDKELFIKRKNAAEAAERPPVISDTGEGIASGQVEIIKNALEILSEQATTAKNKKIAQTATMASLTGKPELKAYNERVKGEKDIDKMIAALTREEAEVAIKHFDTWLGAKAAAKQKKEQEEAKRAAKEEEKANKDKEETEISQQTEAW